jgi:hypothetical protein
MLIIDRWKLLRYDYAIKIEISPQNSGRWRQGVGGR